MPPSPILYDSYPDAERDKVGRASGEDLLHIDSEQGCDAGPLLKNAHLKQLSLQIGCHLCTRDNARPSHLLSALSTECALDLPSTDSTFLTASL